jgi:DNA repair protein RecN (Recombination protein N)
MLTELRVRDLVVISDVTLRLRPGLNVLTGETGAGKSMLVDALSLLVGERASVDLVRPGSSRAVVEAAFDLKPTGDLARAADEWGVEFEDGGIVVRRTINREGRNRAWVNGSPATVGVLAELGQRLVDLHGQHEAQSLLRPSAQRDILDAFGGAAEERANVAHCFELAQRLRVEERALAERREEIQRRADYLKHVVQEIEEVTPAPGEDEALATEAKRLAHAEELTALAERLATLLDGDGEESAVSVLGAAVKVLDQLSRIDESVARWSELLDGAVTGVAELAREVRDYESGIELDPGRLASVETRRDRLFRLLQKYGSTLEEVLNACEGARRELEVLDTADADLSELAERRAEAEQELGLAAESLSEKRRMAAEQLSLAVERLLPGLGMPEGSFTAQIRPHLQIGSAGADAIAFMVQLNRGIEARPLAQVASGGELSRLMLGLKVVLADHDRLPTLVFDEVDQGIGGEIGAQIAEALGEVAQARQVLVITHLPQIAARASHHLRVVKRVRDDMATADVDVLTGAERVAEIARMLGNADDPLLQQHALELLGSSDQLTATSPAPPPNIGG